MHEDIPVVSEENMAANPTEPVLVHEGESSACVPQDDHNQRPDEDMVEDRQDDKRRRLEMLNSVQEMHDVAKEEDEETFVREWCASLNIGYDAEDWSASLRQEYRAHDPKAVDEVCWEVKPWDGAWLETTAGREHEALPDVDPRLVRAAMAVELKKFKELEVFDIVPRETMNEIPGANLIGTRWVLTNKGTSAAPQVKARLVAQEFATGQYRDELFAGTPGLDVVRMLLSDLATGNQGHRRRIGAVLDVASAFLYGAARRPLFIRLPDGAQPQDGRCWIGRLKKSLYGTRDAPLIWHDLLTSTLKSIGFKHSVLNPGLLVHHERGLKLAVHVDDLLVTGFKDDVLWLIRELEAKFTLKSQLFGDDESKAVKYLGREISWGTDGIRWGSTERLVKEVLKSFGMENCNSVSTPVTNSDYTVDAINDTRADMDPTSARYYRSTAAKVNFLAGDRPDLVTASCLLARSMARPRVGDEVKLKRVLRYLRGQPVAPLLFRWQDADETLSLFTDSDWANCRSSRRSCSGGVIRRGSHLLSFWCRVQDRVALSSGEAELLAGNRGLISFLGFLNLFQEMWHDHFGGNQLVHYVDASAARSIMLRHGSGSLKHLEVKDLWAQEVILKKGIEVERVDRSRNLADVVASPSTPTDFRRMIIELGVELRDEAP